MKCHVCGAENPDDAFFCGNCGAQLNSLVTGPGGPVERLGGAIDVKPLIDEPTAPIGAPQSQAPAPPPPPGRIDLTKPSAGLDMPDASPQQPPLPPPAYPGANPAAYQPPAAYHSPTIQPYGQMGGYPPGYGPYQPVDGNTSGMGPGYPAPPEASGWTFAGCVPWGLFAFFNGSVLWGVLGIVLNFFGLWLVYFIYIGIQGKDLAWRNRRFASVQQYAETMHAWNIWGIVLGVLGFIGFVLYFVFIFAVVLAGMQT